MNRTGIALTALLILAIFFSGCTSSLSYPGQSPVSSNTDTQLGPLLLSQEDLPQGHILALDGPMQASDLTEPMKRFGVLAGHRALYADAIPLTDKSKVMEQDIMIFTGQNASAMLDEHRKSFTELKSESSTLLNLPGPDIGEKSFAVKITVTSSSGAETSYYVIGFVRSGIYEVFSREGTPETYPAFLQIVERAAKKIP